MKKKLLSLVLAGAMVASTSVSAFASDTTEISVDKSGTTHRVDVKGNVENEHGEIVSGTITVTVPTAVSFTIDQNGDIKAGNIEIVNRNDERDKVEVIAKEFKDPNPTDGIIIVKDGELNAKIDQNNNAADTKRYISLNLKGTDATVGLISEKGDSNKTGFVNLKTDTEIENSANTSLGTAWRDNNLTLELTGRAKKTGTQYVAPTNAIKSDFNLVLKIQKVR